MLRDDVTAPGTLRCSASSRAVCAAGAVARFSTTAMLARANKPCSVCLGSKLDRADVMRGRLGVIRAAEPPGFRYCCARGILNRPAGPAKKLQRFETLRLLWRRDSVCSKSKLHSAWSEPPLSRAPTCCYLRFYWRYANDTLGTITDRQGCCTDRLATYRHLPMIVI